eukprot:819430-Amphidinium_carterae.1
MLCVLVRGRHRDLESRALAALPAGVQIVWMKAHQSDRDAEKGRVERAFCKGNGWLLLHPTQVPVNMCPWAFRKVEAMEYCLSGCA